jgi:hypothetical protein
VVSVTDPYGRILGFLDGSRYFFLKIALQLYSRGRVDPVPDLLLLRKSGSAGNRTWTSGSVVRLSVTNLEIGKLHKLNNNGPFLQILQKLFSYVYNYIQLYDIYNLFIYFIYNCILCIIYSFICHYSITVNTI